MVGELTKLKKHVEWSLDASMKDTLRDNKKGRLERDQSLQDIMSQLQESMDKLQEKPQAGWQKESRGQRHRLKSGEHRRQKFPRRMTCHWHLWIRHWLLWLQPWHQLDPAQVFHRLRRFRQGRQFQRHQHCRQFDLQGIVRLRMGEAPMSYPLGLEVKGHEVATLLRWSRKSRDVSELFHPHHVTVLWRGLQRSPLWGICRFRGRGNTAG